MTMSFLLSGLVCHTPIRKSLASLKKCRNMLLNGQTPSQSWVTSDCEMSTDSDLDKTRLQVFFQVQSLSESTKLSHYTVTTVTVTFHCCENSQHISNAPPIQLHTS
jgi:hypothetical protein